jgi:hypothetical protein
MTDAVRYLDGFHRNDGFFSDSFAGLSPHHFTTQRNQFVRQLILDAYHADVLITGASDQREMAEAK